MKDLASLEPLFDAGSGAPLPLPPELAALYGTLRFPRPEGRPWVFANFVSTMDGVVTLGTPGHADAGEISGHNAQDLAVMGLLRAAADAVIVGAGTLRLTPRQLFTPGYVQPLFDKVYGLLRERLGKTGPPLTVIVTSRGDVDLSLPVFRSGQAPVLLVTTREGEAKLRVHALPPGVRVTALADAGSLRARAFLDAVASEGGMERIVVEGGPRLLGNFVAEDCVDELPLPALRVPDSMKSGRPPQKQTPLPQRPPSPDGPSSPVRERSLHSRNEGLRLTQVEVPKDRVWTSKDDSRHLSPWIGLPG